MGEAFPDPQDDPRLPLGLGGRWYGVYPALVEDIRETTTEGWIGISLPWAADPLGQAYRARARLTTFMAGANRGAWFIPDVGDEVLVAFQGGDPKQPFVLGSLWNGTDRPPESMDGSGQNHLKALRSRQGLRISLDDSPGSETLRLETPGGQHLELRDGPGSIEIRDAAGTVIRIAPAGVTVSTAGSVRVQASQVEISAATVTVNAGMSKFSGVVQADTLIANCVVGASYTPGVGNIW